MPNHRHSPESASNSAGRLAEAAAKRGPSGQPNADSSAARVARSLPERAHHLLERWRRTVAVLRAPRVRIELYGGDEARAVYRAFTARHPRFKVTAAKRWGVALLRLPATHDEYLRSASRLVRRRRARAIATGFRYVTVSPMAHLDEILEINHSAPSRQGRPMQPSYLDREQVVRGIGARNLIHGVVDSSGRLRAYADVLDIGDAFTFSFLIGHADDLERGIMYLLVTEVVRRCIDARRAGGSPMWLMADTFWGASEGLAYFKERAGFQPFTVDWVWVDRRL